ncbi:MAG TPA: 4Fe-4S dicluster domain-containing protein, partial [Planctomycetes bacterium]|nr:4Fe-4S dicluster domain-containing protein [Planctomycetota bacterium]
MIAEAKPEATATMTLDGVDLAFTEGETIYDVATRGNKDVPTLCYDPRLEAFGACRLCVVEVEGIRNPVASCTTPATAGMNVRTATKTIEKHRRTLLELVASENRENEVDELRGLASQELKTLLDLYEVRNGRFAGCQSGTTNTTDDNPFILRDYDLCISCFRCVRVCAEQEGDHAITMMNRGFEKQITTEFNGILKDSACTFCGQCVQTCPTGALGDIKAMRAESLPGKVEKTRTVCPYCGVGCSVDLLTKEDRL